MTKKIKSIKRATVFTVRHHFSKHKTPWYAGHFWGHSLPWLRLCLCLYELPMRRKFDLVVKPSVPCGLISLFH